MLVICNVYMLTHMCRLTIPDNGSLFRYFIRGCFARKILCDQRWKINVWGNLEKLGEYR